MTAEPVAVSAGPEKLDRRGPMGVKFMGTPSREHTDFVARLNPEATP
jgi:hypothetical protein